LFQGDRLDMGDGAYQARLLRADEARAAYPLVSLEHPGVTLDLWRAFARRANRGAPRRRGLVAVTDRRGTIHAVFAYQVEAGLSAAAALRVSDLVMGRLPGGALPRATLACIDRLAAELGSATVTIDVLDAALTPEDRAALGEAGFAACGVNFSRVSPARSSPAGPAAPLAG